MTAAATRRLRRKDAPQPDAATVAAVAALAHYHPDFAQFNGDVTAELQQVYLDAYHEANPTAALDAGVQAQALAFAQQRAEQLASDLADTTEDQVAQLGEQAKRGGLTLAAFTTLLLGARTFSPDRARTIAATEVTIASGQGARAAAVDLGQDEKRWVTRGDDQVCDDCADNEDAGWISVDDAYPSGDDGVPAHPNCRCHEGYRTSGAKAIVAEAHCPKCGRWVGRNVNVGAEVFCPQHKAVVIGLDSAG